jgi:hypothetical protein
MSDEHYETVNVNGIDELNEKLDRIIELLEKLSKDK